MRRHVHKKSKVPVTGPPAEPIDLTGATIPVAIHRIPGAAVLVTLDDPEADPERARHAFARLRPAVGVLPTTVADWRARVEKVAKAVRVMAAPKNAAVPLTSTRVDVDVAVGNVRDEAIRLAEETKDDDVAALVLRLLDEAGV